MSHIETSETTEQDSDNRTEPPLLPWHSHVGKKLKWQLHSFLPNIISSPYRDNQAYYQETDFFENEATRVPIEEEVRLSVMWGTELFGPAEVDLLYEKLQKLGWDANRTGMPEENAISWIRKQRDYGSVGDFNIGVVSRKGSRYVAHCHAPIPKEVDYLIVEISQLTASLTCVLVGFVFKQHDARSYEKQLIRDRTTTHRRTRSIFGYETWRVDHLKRDSIDTVRAKYRTIAVRWFGKNLPGVFCSIEGGKQMPTAELVTTKNEALLKCRREWATDEPGWAKLLIPHGWGHTWVDAERDGLRLRFDELRGLTPYHTIVSLRTSDVTDEDLQLSSGRRSGALIAFSHERLEGILCHYASLAFLLETSRSLKQSRQNLKAASGRHRHVLRLLENIKRFFDRSLGVPAVVAELNKKCEHIRPFSWNCNKFLEDRFREEDETREIAEVLRAQLAHVSARVLADEETTRAHFEQIATIVSTRESVKAQRRMEWLTVITVVLALCSLLAALPSSWVKASASYLSESRLAAMAIAFLHKP